MYSLRTPNTSDAFTRPTELGGVDDGAHRVGYVVDQAQRRPRHARGPSRTIAVVVVAGGGGGEGDRECPTGRVALLNGVNCEAEEVGGAHAGGRAGQRGWRRLRRAHGRLHSDDRFDIENDGNGNDDDDDDGGGGDREVASSED